jgi:Flp pilus assembly pilin Flp
MPLTLRVCSTARCFIQDDEGATTIEYGLIALLICVLVSGGLTIAH